LIRLGGNSGKSNDDGDDRRDDNQGKDEFEDADDLDDLPDGQMNVVGKKKQTPNGRQGQNSGYKSHTGQVCVWGEVVLEQTEGQLGLTKNQGLKLVNDGKAESTESVDGEFEKALMSDEDVLQGKYRRDLGFLGEQDMQTVGGEAMRDGELGEYSNASLRQGRNRGQVPDSLLAEMEREGISREQVTQLLSEMEMLDESGEGLWEMEVDTEECEAWRYFMEVLPTGIMPTTQELSDASQGVQQRDGFSNKR
jgi:hypothetical protein